MNAAQARATLERLVQPAAAPELTSEEVDELLALARRVDADGRRPYPAWVPDRAYDAGDVVVPTARNGHRYEASAGVAGAQEPAWPTDDGAAVDDATVTWTEAGPDLWVGAYDLYAAAAEGWRWKAGKVASEYNFATDSQRFDRAQQYAHCLEMAAAYARRGRRARSVALRSATTAR